MICKKRADSQRTFQFWPYISIYVKRTGKSIFILQPIYNLWFGLGQSLSYFFTTKVCFFRSPQESSDESGIPSKDESENGREETPYPSSPKKIMNEKILKAQLVAIDRNSIGSCYDNILQQKQDDGDSSVEETDLIDDYHDSDVEPCEEEPVKHDVIEDLVLEESAEYRARETLKNIPANLVCHKMPQPGNC